MQRNDTDHMPLGGRWSHQINCGVWPAEDHPRVDCRDNGRSSVIRFFNIFRSRRADRLEARLHRFGGLLCEPPFRGRPDRCDSMTVGAQLDTLEQNVGEHGCDIHALTDDLESVNTKVDENIVQLDTRAADAFDEAETRLAALEVNVAEGARVVSLNADRSTESAVNTEERLAALEDAVAMVKLTPMFRRIYAIEQRLGMYTDGTAKPSEPVRRRSRATIAYRATEYAHRQPEFLAESASDKGGAVSQ